MEMIEGLGIVFATSKKNLVSKVFLGHIEINQIFYSYWDFVRDSTIMAKVRLTRYEVEEDLLPDVCLLCGEDADHFPRKNFSWHPPWVGVLILAGLLPYAIVAIILTKRMTIHGPLCYRHKNHWALRAWFLYGGLAFFAVVAIAAISLLIALDQPGRRQGNAIGGLVCLGSFVTFLIWLIIAAIFQNTGIRPTEITDRDMALTNVSPHFLDALEEERRARRGGKRTQARRRLDRDDDEEDDWDYERPPRRPSRYEYYERPPRRPSRYEDDEDEDY